MRRNRLATLVLMLWLITISLWGFDLIMALDPIWYSGLFGGYFAVSALYTTFCLLSILTIRANARGLATVPPAAVQDVAKLQFAMSIMWMYFFWSQYLVIWYGNVPVETRFFVRRFFAQPWLTVSWIVLIGGWLIPFVVPAQAPDRPAAAAARAALLHLGARAGGHLPGARAGGLPLGVDDEPGADRRPRPRHHGRLPRALRAEPPLVHGSLPPRSQPPAHGALITWGAPTWPPKPPTLRAPAEPWRSASVESHQGLDMAPKPQTFVAPRRSRGAPL